jgi:hypothetical protein
MTRQRVWNRYSAGIATNYERAEHPLSLATGRMLLGQKGGDTLETSPMRVCTHINQSHHAQRRRQ